MKQKLIFVYNADSGLFNSLSDSLHKVLSPKTYDCNLCRITYGLVSMKKQWREFFENLNYEIEFLHKDEFHTKYKNFKKRKLPAVFILKFGKMKEIIHAGEINGCKTISDLKSLVKKKLEK